MLKAMGAKLVLFYASGYTHFIADLTLGDTSLLFIDALADFHIKIKDEQRPQRVTPLTLELILPPSGTLPDGIWEKSKGFLHIISRHTSRPSPLADTLVDSTSCHKLILFSDLIVGFYENLGMRNVSVLHNCKTQNKKYIEVKI